MAEMDQNDNREEWQETRRYEEQQEETRADSVSGQNDRSDDSTTREKTGEDVTGQNRQPDAVPQDLPEEQEPLPPTVNRIEARGRIISTGQDELGRRAFRLLIHTRGEEDDRVLTFLRAENETARLHTREMVDIVGHIEGYRYRDVWGEWHMGTTFWADQVEPAIPVMKTVFGLNGFLFPDAYIRVCLRGAVEYRLDNHAKTGRVWTTLTIRTEGVNGSLPAHCRIAFSDHMRVADINPKPGDMVAAIVYVRTREKSSETDRHPTFFINLQTDDLAIVRRHAYPDLIREIEHIGAVTPNLSASTNGSDITDTAGSGRPSRRARRRAAAQAAAQAADQAAVQAAQPVDPATPTAETVQTNEQASAANTRTTEQQAGQLERIQQVSQVSAEPPAEAKRVEISINPYDDDNDDGLSSLD